MSGTFDMWSSRYEEHLSTVKCRFSMTEVLDTLCVSFKCYKLTDRRRERHVLNQPEYMKCITLMLLTL